MHDAVVTLPTLTVIRFLFGSRVGTDHLARFILECVEGTLVNRNVPGGRTE